MERKKAASKQPGYLPNYSTFPLEDAHKRESGSKVSIPSLEEIEDSKKWVDFKEM